MCHFVITYFLTIFPLALNNQMTYWFSLLSHSIPDTSETITLDCQVFDQYTHKAALAYGQILFPLYGRFEAIITFGRYLLIASPVLCSIPLLPATTIGGPHKNIFHSITETTDKIFWVQILLTLYSSSTAVTECLLEVQWHLVTGHLRYSIFPINIRQI